MPKVKVFDLDKIAAKEIIGGPIKPIITNKKGGTKTQLLALGVFKPGEGLYPHIHPNSEEIYFVLKGKGTVFIGKRRKAMQIKENQVIYIPAGTPHGVTNTSKKGELIIGFIMTPGIEAAKYRIDKDTKVIKRKVLTAS
jgi:mannose-6-phosphate isomerase-like protein (cupin superfamily)